MTSKISWQDHKNLEEKQKQDKANFLTKQRQSHEKTRKISWQYKEEIFTTKGTGRPLEKGGQKNHPEKDINVYFITEPTGVFYGTCYLDNRAVLSIQVRGHLYVTA